MLHNLFMFFLKDVGVRRRRISPLPAVVLVMFAIAGCGGSETAFAPNPPAGRAGEPGRFTPGHLYVADSGFYTASKVYRFPLDANGLPSKTPDGVLTLSARNPGSIAIGPDGDLYVSSAGTASGCKNKCLVEVFAPGASHHAKPIRVLDVPQQPLYIAVDQQGYLDVSTLKSGGDMTNVYAPNAQGHDKPVNKITTSGVNAFAASRGIVYIQTLLDVEGVAELSQSNAPVDYTYYSYSSNGVATEGGHLYAQFFSPHGTEFFLATAVYRIDMPGPPIRTIVGTGCVVSFSGGALGYGLAAYKKYIYEGCIGVGGANGSVLVYDSTKSGNESPLVTLPGGDAGVAIGP